MEVRRGDGSVIAVEAAGKPDGAPVLLCHGLADSRLSALQFTDVAAELGLWVIAPDRPGSGRSDPGRLRRLADWAQDAALVLDAMKGRIGGRGGHLRWRAVRRGVRCRDRRAIGQPSMRDAFLANYTEAFRRGSQGVAQDLRLLSQPWGFQLAAIRAPASVHHGDADTTVPPEHARRYAEAIPGARLQLHPGHGHFSILTAAREMLAPLCR